jgi:REP element-mobilizing transposase RayT
MSTYTQILYQIVFGSKGCKSFLNHENQGHLFGYIVSILTRRECHAYQVGGFANHIHIVTHLSTNHSLAEVVREIKRASNEMMKMNKDLFPDFPGWQVGYGAFTYHYSKKQVLINYVLNQEVHHMKLKYENELIGLLNDNKIPYKEEYLLT